jgi:hypothetical protein
MGTGYTRNDTSNNIADGNVINASDLDGEFDAVQAAFNGTTGHSHDGTSGEGPQIDTAGIANDAVTLGTKTSGNYVAAGATSGTGISGSVSSEGGTFTVTSNATNANTASTIVARDGSGNFSAGTITASLTGTASNANQLDSLDSTQFLRSDAADSKTAGDLTFSDSVKAVFGTGSDLQIYHDASNSYIKEDGDGSLLIWSTGTETKFLGGSGAETMLDLNVDGSVDLYHDNAVKLATKSDGVDITGELQSDSLDVDGNADISGTLTMGGNINLQDNDTLRIGTGADLRLYHDGSDSYIDDIGTGDLYIRANDQLRLQKYTGENMIVGNVDGAVQLYHNNSEKLATTSYGIDISGSAVADTHTSVGVGATPTPDMSTYQNFIWTLNANANLGNPSTEKTGQTGFFVFIQDGTGGHTLSLASEYKTAGGAGIALSTAPNAVDIVPYIVQTTGTILLGTPQLAFS